MPYCFSYLAVISNLQKYKMFGPHPHITSFFCLIHNRKYQKATGKHFRHFTFSVAPQQKNGRRFIIGTRVGVFGMWGIISPPLI